MCNNIILIEFCDNDVDRYGELYISKIEDYIKIIEPLEKNNNQIYVVHKSDIHEHFTVKQILNYYDELNSKYNIIEYNTNT